MMDGSPQVLQTLMHFTPSSQRRAPPPDSRTALDAILSRRASGSPYTLILPADIVPADYYKPSRLLWGMGAR